jgi:UDP-N-acetylmuramate dehydrogenase
LGGGSNIVVSDEGVRGLVILNRARKIEFSPGRVKAESGASFSTLAQHCIARGYGGLEWAVGIPGTVGGAVVGNAGAWGSDVAQTLKRATILGQNGQILSWPAERFRYGYRTSILKQMASEHAQQTVILDAEFALEVADAEALRQRAATITAKRKEKQPKGATCGSVFKNPTGDYAGRLIEEAGLKGRCLGGAQVSARHANFFLNLGQATATDIKGLIDLVQRTVLDQFGVALEMEIELIGEW